MRENGTIPTGSRATIGRMPPSKTRRLGSEPVLPIRAVASIVTAGVRRALARVPAALGWIDRLPMGVSRIVGLVVGSPAPAEPVPPPPVAEITPFPGTRAPTPFHDHEADPVRVTVAAGVYRRLVRELLTHVDGPDGTDETGWIPIGGVEDGAVRITGLLPKGPEARASSGDFEIDQPFVVAALALARNRAPGVGVVGLVHSHPGRMSWQSTTDLATDREHVKTIAGGVGVYPILTRSELPDGRHETTDAGLRTTFYAMRASRPERYVRCEVTFEPVDDAGAWVGGYERALSRCARTFLALATDERLEVSLVPTAGREGAVDLVARGPERALLARFSPELELVCRSSDAGPERLDIDAVPGPRLARALSKALCGEVSRNGRQLYPTKSSYKAEKE